MVDDRGPRSSLSAIVCDDLDFVAEIPFTVG